MISLKGFALYIHNTSPRDVVMEVYGLSPDSCCEDYVIEKMRAIRKDALAWYGSLDTGSLRRLAATIRKRYPAKR